MLQQPPFQLKTSHALIALLILAPTLTYAETATTASSKKTAPAKNTSDATKDSQLAFEDMVITEIDSEDGKAEIPSKTDFSTPKVRITKKDLEKFNATTTADSVKYQSGVFVRQRYIGDPNAPIGMRGSNPYQGGRVMVFMDGMPIWNSLQTSFNGSPRWGLIGPDEIKSVEVLSGPFSAEHSGNAMGGVVNFTTLLPQKREIYTEATYMLQPYSNGGTSQNLQGFKTFGSYGDKFGKLSSYFSYNHLENEGQPMSTVNTSNTAGPNGGPLVPYTTGGGAVNGGIFQANPKAIGTVPTKTVNGVKYPNPVPGVAYPNQGGAAGQPNIVYGDAGVVRSIDNLYKWKGGYAITPKLDALFTTAFEDLDVSNTGKTYLTDASGKQVYGNGTTNYNFNGLNVKPTNNSFGTSNQNRQTFTVGAGLKGEAFGKWNTDTNVSWFDVLHDQTVSSTLNPSDPLNKNAGQVSNVDNMGWVNLKSKFDTEEFLGRKDLSFSTGFEFQNSNMFTSQYASNNYTTTQKENLTLRSGGITNTYAVFGQLTWRFLQDWDATFGTRLERWNSTQGVYQSIPSGQTSLVNQYLPDRQASGFSPKFSLGFSPNRMQFRYSLGEAYRFPMVAELFDNSNSLSGAATVGNATLKPENGLHQNILSEYNFNNGFVRLNLFHEEVKNAIYSSYISNSALGNNINPSAYTSSLSNIGEVKINGIDLTVNQNQLFNSNFDAKIDSTILNSQITQNYNDPNYVGKSFPLLPNFRANGLGTYHFTKDIDTSVGIRYQSKMYSQLDNKDQNLPYYAAFNSSVFVDLKSTYHFNDKKGHISAGIDNVNDYRAYYNHPLPLRSFFMQVGYKF